MPDSKPQTTLPHPWYAGGCDALGPDGTCAECAKLTPPNIGRLEAEIVLLRSQLLTARSEVERLLARLRKRGFVVISEEVVNL